MSEERSFSKSFTTKLRIFEAFGTCLSTTPIDKLTVSAICSTANVGKSTFYQYFKDKFAVAQWYLDMLYETGVTQIGRTLSWHRGHYITTSGIVQQRDVFVAAAQSNDYNAINSYSERKREDMLIETLTAYQGIALTPNLRAQAIALAAGERAVMARLMKEGDYPPINEIVDCLISIVPRELYIALEKPKRIGAEDLSANAGMADALLSLKREHILRADGRTEA